MCERRRREAQQGTLRDNHDDDNDDGDGEGAGGREEEGEREHEARSGKAEIQFERCMLDSLAGPAHFEIGYSFYCESGLLPAYTASEFTAESRTRKGRAGRKRGRVAGKGKGRV